MTKNKTKTKVYFWLKFDKKFFDNLFIKRLKNVSGGYAMTVIYIRLMLESLETDCIIYYEGYFDSLIQELAIRLDVSEDDINMTLSYFTKCGLIQIDTDGNARFPQAEALLEQETNWNQYKRKIKNSKNIPTKLEKFQPDSNQIPTEIEIEKEKELNIDIETEVEVEDRNRQMSSSATDGQSDFNIFGYYQERIGPLDGYQMEKLKDYIDIDNMEIMLVKRAIDRAADNSKRSFGYVNSILKSWAQNGIKTIAQQDEEQRSFEGRKNNDNQTVKFGPACSKY